MESRGSGFGHPGFVFCVDSTPRSHNSCSIEGWGCCIQFRVQYLRAYFLEGQAHMESTELSAGDYLQANKEWTAHRIPKPAGVHVADPFSIAIGWRD